MKGNGYTEGLIDVVGVDVADGIDVVAVGGMVLVAGSVVVDPKGGFGSAVVRGRELVAEGNQHKGESIRHAAFTAGKTWSPYWHSTSVQFRAGGS